MIQDWDERLALVKKYIEQQRDCNKNNDTIENILSCLETQNPQHYQNISFDEVRQINEGLVAKHGMLKKLEKASALDKVPPFYIHIGWSPEPEYQPVHLSWIIANTLLKKKMFYDRGIDLAREGKKLAEKEKQEYRKLQTLCKQLGKFNDTPFKTLLNRTNPYSPCFNEKASAHSFWSVAAQRENINSLREALLDSSTNPHLKHFGFYCQEMTIFFKKRSGKPHYSLIASISNEFSISPTHQNNNSIRQRVFRTHS